MDSNQKKIFNEAEKLLEKNNLSSNLIFITRKIEKNGYSYDFKKVLLNDKVQENFRKIYLSKISSLNKKLHKLRLGKYSPTNKSDDILYITSSSTEYIPKNGSENSLIQINKDTVPIIKDSELASEFYERIWGYIVVFEDENKSYLRVFSRYASGKILRKSRLNGLFIKNGSFTKIDRDIFKMDYKIHCFLLDNSLIILHKKSFEELFKLEKKFKEESEEVLEDIIEKNIKISNWEDFKEKCCDNIIMMRKLSNIKSKGYYKKINFEKIKKMKQNYKLSFSINESEKSIIYNNYQEIWDILALFDDDLLKSELTQNRYEARSKKEI